MSDPPRAMDVEQTARRRRLYVIFAVGTGFAALYLALAVYSSQVVTQKVDDVRDLSSTVVLPNDGFIQTPAISEFEAALYSGLDVDSTAVTVRQDATTCIEVEVSKWLSTRLLYFEVTSANELIEVPSC